MADASPRPVRSFVAALRSPAIRARVGELLAGRSIGAAVDDPLVRLGVATEEDGVLRLRAGFFDDAVATLDAVLDPLHPVRAGLVHLADVPIAGRDAAVAEVARRTVAPGEVLGERELNGRLALVVDDVAVVRRRAVDTGALVREADGSAYRLTDRGGSAGR